ncbi:MAG: hypothetical protein P4L59_12220 [Desulfosporosinus sp.]|nr:hypothetical protein [Desulfosporosinus sp.]
MAFKKIFKGRALYVDHDTIWVAKGLCFYSIDFNGQRTSPKYNVGSIVEKFIGSYRLTRQLLRVGIHHLLLLVDGSFLVALKKRIVIMSPDGMIKNIFTDFQGNKPAHRGMCVTPEGSIFLGEYTLNMDRKNTSSLYRSKDNGQTFECLKTFQPDEIRHIHFIQWDTYDNCLWLGTGDRDEESKLYRSYDNGDTFELIGEGNQLWRAVGVSFTEESLYWGTDAGSDAGTHPNYVIKMDRQTHQLEKILEVEGPCHGNAVLGDGTVYVSTGIEGGENEKDRAAHLWRKKGKDFEHILKQEKDIFPHILQYGVMRFPLGLQSTNTAVFTTYGLKRFGEDVLVEDGK